MHFYRLVLLPIAVLAITCSAVLAQNDSEPAPPAGMEAEAVPQESGEAAGDSKADEPAEEAEEIVDYTFDPANTIGFRGAFDMRKLLELAFERWQTAWCDAGGELTEHALQTLVKRGDASEVLVPDGKYPVSDPNADPSLSAQSDRPQYVAQQDFAGLFDTACQCDLPRLAIEWLERVEPLAAKSVDLGLALASIARQESFQDLLDILESPPARHRNRFETHQDELRAETIVALCDTTGPQDASVVQSSLCDSSSVKHSIELLQSLQDDRFRMMAIHDIALCQLLSGQSAATILNYSELTVDQTKQVRRKMVASIAFLNRLQINRNSATLVPAEYMAARSRLKAAMKFARETIASDQDVAEVITLMFTRQKSLGSTPQALAILDICLERSPTTATNVIGQLISHENSIQKAEPKSIAARYGRLNRKGTAWENAFSDRLDKEFFLQLDTVTQIRLAHHLVRVNRLTQAVQCEQFASGWPRDSLLLTPATNGSDSASSKTPHLKKRTAKRTLLQEKREFYFDLADRIARTELFGETVKTASATDSIVDEGGRKLCELRTNETRCIIRTMFDVMSGIPTEESKAYETQLQEWIPFETKLHETLGFESDWPEDPNRPSDTIAHIECLAHARVALMVALANTGKPNAKQPHANNQSALHDYLLEMRKVSPQTAVQLGMFAAGLQIAGKHYELVMPTLKWVTQGAPESNATVGPSTDEEVAVSEFKIPDVFELLLESIEYPEHWGQPIAHEYIFDQIGLKPGERKRLLHATLQRMIDHYRTANTERLLRAERESFKDFQFTISDKPDDAKRQYSALAALYEVSDLLPACEHVRYAAEIRKQLTSILLLEPEQFKAVLLQVDQNDALHPLINRIPFQSIINSATRRQVLIDLVPEFQSKRLLNALLSSSLPLLERSGLLSDAEQLARRVQNTAIASRNLRDLALLVHQSQTLIQGGN